MNVSFCGQESLIVDSINRYYDDEKYLDLTFICKGNVKVKAHKMVLASVSPFLKDMFVTNDEHVHISVPEVTAHHMKVLLNYLYVGSTKVNSEELQGFKCVLTLLKIRLPCASVSKLTSHNAPVFSTDISNGNTATATLISGSVGDSNMCSTVNKAVTENSSLVDKIEPNLNASTDIMNAESEEELSKNQIDAQGACSYEQNSILPGQKFPLLRLIRCDFQSDALKCQVPKQLQNGGKRSYHKSDSSHSGIINVRGTRTEIKNKTITSREKRIKIDSTIREGGIKKMQNVIIRSSSSSTTLDSVAKMINGKPCNTDPKVDTVVPVIRVKDISSLQSRVPDDYNDSSEKIIKNIQSSVPVELKHNRKDVKSNSGLPVIRVKQLSSLCSAVSVNSTGDTNGGESKVLPYSKGHVIRKTKHEKTMECKLVQQCQAYEANSSGQVQSLCEIEYKCYICSNIYKDKINFISHIITHSNKNDYYRFQPQTTMKTNRLRSNEKTRGVKNCGWDKLSDSSVHTNPGSHLHQKPYKCSRCDASFYLKSRLHSHMQVHHECARSPWRN